MHLSNQRIKCGQFKKNVTFHCYLTTMSYSLHAENSQLHIFFAYLKRSLHHLQSHAAFLSSCNISVFTSLSQHQKQSIHSMTMSKNEAKPKSTKIRKMNCSVKMAFFSPSHPIWNDRFISVFKVCFVRYANGRQLQTPMIKLFLSRVFRTYFRKKSVTCSRLAEFIGAEMNEKTKREKISFRYVSLILDNDKNLKLWLVKMRDKES